MATEWRDENITSVLFNTSRKGGQRLNLQESEAGMVAAYGCLLLLSLVGNALVLVVVYRDRRLRTNVNLFIANMAASDLLFPIFGVPYRITSLVTRGRWLVDGIVGEALCKVVTFAGDISNMVSILSLVAIAVDRFGAVVFPMSSKLITRRVRSTILCATWLVSVAFFSPYFYAMRLQTGRTNITECLFKWGDKETTISVQLNYIFVNFACFIAVPLLLLIVLYSVIVFSLVRQNLVPAFSTEQRKHRARENRRVAFMSVVVVMVFIISFVPYNVLLFLVFVKGKAFTLQSPLVLTSHFLSVTYPTVNPLVYYIFNEKYREGLQKVFRQRSVCKKNFKMSTRHLQLADESS